MIAILIVVTGARVIRAGGTTVRDTRIVAHHIELAILVLLQPERPLLLPNDAITEQGEDGALGCEDVKQCLQGIGGYGAALLGLCADEEFRKRLFGVRERLSVQHELVQDVHQRDGARLPGHVEEPGAIPLIQ